MRTWRGMARSTSATASSWFPNRSARRKFSPRWRSNDAGYQPRRNGSSCAAYRRGRASVGQGAEEAVSEPGGHPGVGLLDGVLLPLLLVFGGAEQRLAEDAEVRAGPCLPQGRRLLGVDRAVIDHRLVPP